VSVELRLSPAVSACYNYVGTDGKERKVTVVISPIGVERKGEKTVISWACNRGATCHNRGCRYSFLAKVPVATKP
jgi:hypothetical protein